MDILENVGSLLQDAWLARALAMLCIGWGVGRYAYRWYLKHSGHIPDTPEQGQLYNLLRALMESPHGWAQAGNNLVQYVWPNNTAGTKPTVKVSWVDKYNSDGAVYLNEKKVESVLNKKQLARITARAKEINRLLTIEKQASEVNTLLSTLR